MVYQGNPNLIENHGRWYMELQDLGYNYRIPDILCALGISQLSRADKGIERRRAIAKRYDEAFTNTSIKTHVPAEGIGHAYHLYVIEVNNRKELYDALRAERIYAQIHYVPVHLMPYYRQFGNKKGDMPIAEAYYSGCISLPMYPTLTDEEQAFVIEKVLEFSK
jgi:dTDP-4-amino-4,6-dideoxygalactose transaminase